MPPVPKHQQASSHVKPLVAGHPRPAASKAPIVDRHAEAIVQPATPAAHHRSTKSVIKKA